jgi:hypothetical protein
VLHADLTLASRCIALIARDRSASDIMSRHFPLEEDPRHRFGEFHDLVPKYIRAATRPRTSRPSAAPAVTVSEPAVATDSGHPPKDRAEK